MSASTMDLFDLWTAATKRDRMTGALLDLAMQDVGRYAASQDPRTNALTTSTIERVRELQADRYETRAAAGELFEAFQNSRSDGRTSTK